MPVPLRTTYHKAEAKYNVTTEFPSLGLHSAAATGNVGLVEYALDHGQPINSVLDGVLPLHAACAGGSDQVVRLLIEHGADVNAPRLPRRYSNEKSRNASAPIVGTSGSTPLHFAAANGNTNIVQILLLYGAHADLADKHGITPEMLARQHGWVECADVLHSWLINKDKDLRERESLTQHSMNRADLGADRGLNISSDVLNSHIPHSSHHRRRLHVKQSIDTALNMLKSSSTGLSESYRKGHNHQHASSSKPVIATTPPTSPFKPFGEYSFIPHSSSQDNLPSPIDPGSRRPSLPQVLIPTTPVRSRKTSAPHDSAGPRRPSSAGTGADRGVENDANSNGAVRKLGSKYSLMNLFKKGQIFEGPYDSAYSSSSTSVPIPVPVSPARVPSTGSYLSSSPHSASPIPQQSSSTLNLTEKPSPSSPFSRSFRFHRGSDASLRARTAQQAQLPQANTKAIGTSSSPSRPPIPLAVDLHNALARQQHQHHSPPHTARDRSRSSGVRVRYEPTSLEPEDSLNGSGNVPGNSGSSTRIGMLRGSGHNRDRSGSSGSLGAITSSLSVHASLVDDKTHISGVEPRTGGKPGILTSHHRAPSGGQGSLSPAAFRALRFDPGVAAAKPADSRHNYPLRSSGSVGSLINSRSGDIGEELRLVDSALSDRTEGDLDHLLLPESAPVTSTSFQEFQSRNKPQVEEDDLDYGQPVENPQYVGIFDGDSTNPAHAPSILMPDGSGHLATSSPSSLSPIDTTLGDASLSAEFPFSISRPPLVAKTSDANDSPHEHLQVPAHASNRGRGDSLSSSGTADSRGRTVLSPSGGTSSSDDARSVTVTPPIYTPDRDRIDSVKREQDYTEQNDQLINGNTNALGLSSGLNERRARTPLDIDISAISSHAQAAALVQRAQQEILEMEVDENDLLASGGSAGWTPLSERLAAYGESLALERKLREQKRAQEEAFNELRSFPSESQRQKQELSNGQTSPTREDETKPSHDNDSVGIERQRSLEHRLRAPPMKGRARDPKRPSTAEGVSTRRLNNSFSGDQTARAHQPSRSASAFGPSQSGRISVEGGARSEDREHFQVTSRRLQSGSTSADPLSSWSRSRQAELEHGQLSRISSLDGLETDTDLGAIAARISGNSTGGSTRDKRVQARSATKLTRMGFSPIEQASRVLPQQAIQQQSGPNQPQHGTKRFGAFKSFFKSK